MGDELLLYLRDLEEETELRTDEYPNRAVAFTSHILSEISGLLNIDEPVVVYGNLKDTAGRSRGEIYGYAFSNGHEVLTLFGTIYEPSDSSIRNITNVEYQTSINKLQGFYNSAIRGVYYDLDEKNPLYEPAKLIYDNLKEINTIRLCVLSNCMIKDYEIKNNRIAGKLTTSDIWDIKKLYANLHGCIDHIPIDIDFKDEYSNYKIPYIEMESTDSDYKCYLAMFPGKLLYRLYEKHNTDLLLNNVRYFLGFKGSKKSNANICILETLKKESQMFLAYNNGITALAANIDVDNTGGSKTDISEEKQDGSRTNEFISTGILSKIFDFQIVNGGQTTASIFNAKNRDRSISLLGVYVQVKILVLNGERKDVAANITKFSNSQSRIKYADFSVSNEFNIRLQELSRNTLIPSEKHDIRYWFYERVRGQYDQERKKNSLTKDSLILFDANYPKSCKFKKELVAKVWKSWNMEPFDAVKGEGTNYDLFISKIVDSKYIPDEVYYKHTIALIIIYNYLFKRPENRGYANKKASVIAYTISLLNYISCGKINLLKIWEKQDLSDNLKLYLNELCEIVCTKLTALAEEKKTTVLSYGKRKDTFNELVSTNIFTDKSLLSDDIIIP